MSVTWEWRVHAAAQAKINVAKINVDVDVYCDSHGALFEGAVAGSWSETTAQHIHTQTLDKTKIIHTPNSQIWTDSTDSSGALSTLSSDSIEALFTAGKQKWGHLPRLFWSL